MQYLKNESEHGVVEYRLPNVPEALELYARMGVNPADFSDSKNMINNGFYLTSKVIANMGFLLGKIELKVGDRAVVSHEEMVKEVKLLGVMCEIAARIIEAMNGGSEEKKTL